MQILTGLRSSGVMAPLTGLLPSVGGAYMAAVPADIQRYGPERGPIQQFDALACNQHKGKTLSRLTLNRSGYVPLPRGHGVAKPSGLGAHCSQRGEVES
jgi:hypothetical protein